ncbi:hypothetical protein [Streptomyces sp. NBC_00069]|uniref:hypothetical protein n=1 Tax=Streptomyces sp. NBC_00069 TaxID=2975639 RepID=UPI00324B59B9
MNASTTSRRSRHRALAVAALTAAAVTGQLLVMSPLAQADGDRAADASSAARKLLDPPPGLDELVRGEDPRHEDGPPPGGEESKPSAKPKPKAPPHGVQEYTNDGTFVPPPGVTSVFIQAWGAGGGGGGGGGLAWCSIPVKPGKSYVVLVGDGGTGGTGGAGATGGGPGAAGNPGTAGSATTLASPGGDILVTAGGGGGGGGGGTTTDGEDGTPGTGGTATCRTGGVTRPGEPGGPGGSGGGVADGIIGLPDFEGLGGIGAAGGGSGTTSGGNGGSSTGSGDGYAVIFW